MEATEKPINIAYSNVGLGFHQDLVYYESPPGDDVVVVAGSAQALMTQGMRYNPFL